MTDTPIDTGVEFREKTMTGDDVPRKEALSRRAHLATGTRGGCDRLERRTGGGRTLTNRRRLPREQGVAAETMSKRIQVVKVKRSHLWK